MEKDFTPYDRALRLKVIGFYCDCFGDYFKFGNQDSFLVTDEDRYRIEEDNEGEDILRVPAPTFSQAFRWFREKYGLYSWVELHNGYIDDSYYKKLPITWTIMESESGKQYYERDTDHNYLYHTHEEAELACLDKLLEIVEGIESQK